MVVLRNDFMIDVPTNSVKLVEYNTIASSFGILSESVRKMHEYIRNKYGSDVNYLRDTLSPSALADEEDKEILRFGNDKQLTFMDDMLSSFKEALEHYSSSVKAKFGHQCEDPWVLFVVEDSERNVIDQKVIETEL